MTIKYHSGILTAAAIGSLFCAVPLLAQTVTTQTTVTQAPQADPGAAAAQQVNGDQLRDQQTAQQQVQAQRDQQYAEDRAVYEAALRARGRKIERQDARYEREQNAYLNAMSDWRIQVEACKNGKSKICNAPAPDPANYL